MTRSVMRYTDWTIRQDHTEGASPPLYEMECTTCTERSGPAEVAEDAQHWALAHSGRHPTHTGYRGIGTSFWRTHPTSGPAPAAFTGRRDAAPLTPGTTP